MIIDSHFHFMALDEFRRPIDIPTYDKASVKKNFLDKDVLYTRALGIPESVFHNAARVLGLSR